MTRRKKKKRTMKATKVPKKKTSAIEISRAATSGSLRVHLLQAISFLMVLSYTRVMHWRGGVYRVSNEIVMDSRKGFGLGRRKVTENDAGGGMTLVRKNIGLQGACSSQ